MGWGAPAGLARTPQPVVYQSVDGSEPQLLGTFQFQNP